MKTIYRLKFWIIAIVIATATFQTGALAQEADGVRKIPWVRNKMKDSQTTRTSMLGVLPLE